MAGWSHGGVPRMDCPDIFPSEVASDRYLCPDVGEHLLLIPANSLPCFLVGGGIWSDTLHVVL